MPLSWNEIKSRAQLFTAEWKDEVSEDAEAKSFWDDFFHVFGISRRRVATFEQQVKKTDNKQGFIDLLWKGVILIEHKSRGKDLARAYQQAKDYFPGLKEKELPRYILVSDFERFVLYDLEENTQQPFALKDFVHHVQLFGFIAGYQKRTYKEQDPVNIEAAELMGRLHDKLKAIGYTGHHLELYLVRLLFLLFADDTNIFERGIFQDYIEDKTAEDGSDLAAHISQLFYILNTPKEKRYTNIDEALAQFPYVNGKLFEETLPPASFDGAMRKLLYDCCLLDWGKISPAIFGSLFQSVMDEKARRNLGAHYTSEKNIFKLIKPLFLDELHAEFEKARDNKNSLQKLQKKIGNLRFLDPACGCGNFLIMAYRELRLLEMEIVKILLKGQTVTDIGYYFLLDVDRFCGIEYEEFPAQIAQVAMWLIDHQMNMKASETFGEYYVRLPLRRSANIVHGNALRIDWQSLIEPMPFEKGEAKFDYILGNPPFVGSKWMNDAQRIDMDFVGGKIANSGLLDYVAAWYIKSSDYLKLFSSTVVAFVSTNSITQGEQVYPLWTHLLDQGTIIHFAYRTFNWSNEARGNAAVHCVIIGFGAFDIANKRLFTQEGTQIVEVKANRINPYLIDAKSILIPNRSKPICNVKEIATGNKPIDNGEYIFEEEQYKEFILKEPESKKYIFHFLGAEEFINNKKRYILYLKNVSPEVLKAMPFVIEKIQRVKSFREQSNSKPTQKLALTPTLYHTENVPTKPFLVIPQVSSVRRKYIPIGYLNPIIICSDKLRLMKEASLYEFGILTSETHMAWMRTITGRLKSDYQYSVLNVYNNFPWPETPTDKQKETVENAAQAVLDARAQFPNASLADLYDPNTMPPVLVKAHQALDKAVDACYRSQAFINETKRIEYLFELYDKYTAGLFAKDKKKLKNN